MAQLLLFYGSLNGLIVFHLIATPAPGLIEVKIFFVLFKFYSDRIKSSKHLVKNFRGPL